MADKLKSKLGWIVAVSVLLNIFLVGFIVGGSFQHGDRHAPDKGYRKELKEQLSPDHAKLFRRTMRELRKEDRALREEMEKVRQEIFAALAGASFDEASYRQKVRDLHDLHGKRIGRRTDAIVALAPALSQSEREAVAKHLERRKHKKHKKQGHSPPPPPARP